MRRLSSWSSTTRIRPAHAAPPGASTRTGNVNGEGRACAQASTRTQMRPPCSSTMRLAMASPRPVPPFCACSSCRPAGTPRRSAAWSASAIPGPVSATATTNASSARVACDRHLAGLGELDGVADEVEQHLGEAPLVAPAERQVGRDLDAQREPLLGRQRLDGRDDRLHHLRQRVVVERQGELAGLDLGQVEHVVDQAEQVPAARLHALEHLADLLGHLAVDAVQDQLGVAEDGVERRAQLVAHVGQELRLVLAGDSSWRPLLLDLVEQPRVLDRQHRLRRRRS